MIILYLSLLDLKYGVRVLLLFLLVIVASMLRVIALIIFIYLLFLHFIITLRVPLLQLFTLLLLSYISITKMITTSINPNDTLLSYIAIIIHLLILAVTLNNNLLVNIIMIVSECLAGLIEFIYIITGYVVLSHFR
jgi:hypothetical protein